ncbi:Uncharacterized protein AC499_1415 [Pseudomonas amygdali pv. lachrymans]|uniref:Uncharacterized protein n=1 Tax=Pseudomonas amygdali pv. lachrymans TaxID=53707 RepID=A0ABR5KTQ6_PSEAV|nr:Uncharacterized protein AC499_0456 [Pseudomonas amygdali pv. lachrymans]KPC18213.1 Uncharacterized protein AC499_1415 [Pseudomonas amygdali pv. lachrymans]
MVFDYSHAQLSILKKVAGLQDYELCRPAIQDTQYTLVALGLSLIDAFGSVQTVLEAGGRYCHKMNIKDEGNFLTLVNVVLLTDGPHLAGLIARLAQEIREAKWHFPLASIKWSLQRTLEELTYDRDEAHASRESGFYAPRYPGLTAKDGVERFDPDDYLVIFEELLALHAHHCLGDLLDLPDLCCLLTLFETKRPERYQRLCQDFSKTLIDRQVEVDDPRRLKFLPRVPGCLEMDQRMSALINHIMMPISNNAETMLLGNCLESRCESVERFGKALMAFPPEDHSAFKSSISERFGLYLRPDAPGSFQWLSEDFFRLDDRMKPIRDLFAAFDAVSFYLDDLLLSCMRAQGDSEFPLHAPCPLDDHQRAMCVGYILESPLYEENWFRESFVQIIGDRIDKTLVRWDELGIERASLLYKLSPAPLVIHHTTIPGIRDAILQADLGL